MTNLRIGPVLSVEPGTSTWQNFDAELIAFDKDGTLIDVEFMWGRLAVAWVERLTAGRPDPRLGDELFSALGYDRGSQRILPQSPLAIATAGQLHTILAATLFRFGTPWTEAETRVREVSRQAYEQIPLAELVRPASDLPALLGRLASAGLRLAIVTTDHRIETEKQLQMLGITDLVDGLVCGDDGIPTKPAPDMLLAVCRQLGIEPARTVVVGDTEADLLMARNAGAGLAVAVLNGAGAQTSLSEHADAVLQSIDGIHIGAS